MKIVEVFKDQPDDFQIHAEDRDEVRMKPMEEISMSHDHQMLIAAIGSGFTHSRIDSGQMWGNPLMKKTDDMVNDSSYRAFVEENKSEAKIIEHEFHPHHTQNGTDEKFEVIREDIKDSFYSPHTFKNHE